MGRHKGLAGTQTAIYNHGSEIRQVQGMVKERGGDGAARASRVTEQGEDKIRNKHVYCGIAGL